MWRRALDLDTEIILWIALQVARHKDLYESFNIFIGSLQASALLACNIVIGYVEYK